MTLKPGDDRGSVRCQGLMDTERSCTVSEGDGSFLCRPQKGGHNHLASA